MLLLHPVPTCADAGPDLCTLHSDLYTLCLRWLSPVATYGAGVSPSAVGTETAPAPTWFHSLQLAPVVFYLPPTGADTRLTLGQLALCGGGIHIYTEYAK